MKIVVTLVIAFGLAMYIYLVYRIVTKRTFYYKNYGIAMAIMPVITAGIILAMQSSLVISLGMVGALSIVRFRTAIKDPLDLLFLFWSIGIGIICGAGLYELAIETSVAATLGILLLEWLQIKKSTYLLVINSLSLKNEEDIIYILKKYTKGYKIRSKNVSGSGVDYTIEVKMKVEEKDLMNQLTELPEVDSVSLLEHDVDI